MTRRAGSGPERVPSSVHSVLRSPGEPLAEELQREFAPRFQYDFSDVRVHTDAAAAASARQVGALAYTWGNHVVLRQDADPRQALAHELGHVVQQDGRVSGLPHDILPADSVAETNAHSPSRSAPVGLALLRDSRLDQRLARLKKEAADWPLALSDEGYVDHVVEVFRGVALGDPDNLNPVLDAVTPLLGIGVAVRLLERIEANPHVARPPAPSFPTGGPGMGTPIFMRANVPILPKEVTDLAKPFLMLDVGARSAEAFLTGVVDGMRPADNPGLYDELAKRVADAGMTQLGAPALFSAGALAGVGKDMWEQVKGMLELVTNLTIIVEQTKELLVSVVSPGGPEIAREIGKTIGSEFQAELASIVNETNTARFTYRLGEVVGPTIIYTLLSLVGGAGVVIGATIKVGKGLRIATKLPKWSKTVDRLRPFFKKAPDKVPDKPDKPDPPKLPKKKGDAPDLTVPVPSKPASSAPVVATPSTPKFAAPKPTPAQVTKAPLQKIPEGAGRLSGKGAEKKVLEYYRRVRPVEAETPTRFALHNPLTKGGKANKFDEIGRQLTARFAKLGKKAPKLNLSILDEDVAKFALRYPELREEFTNLYFAYDGPGNTKYRTLPAKYRFTDTDTKKEFERFFFEGVPEKGKTRTGRVGNREPDIVEFFLDEDKIVVTDISQRGKHPWHQFKTKFYQRVLKEMLKDMKVEAFELETTESISLGVLE